MKSPKAADVKKRISAIWETLQCPICLELMVAPVSTKCDHQFCKSCMTLLLNSTKHNRTNCPVCKAKVTRRSLQESPGFQGLIAGLQDMIWAYEHDSGTNYFTGQTLQKQPAVVTGADANKHAEDETSEDVSQLNNLKNTCSNDLPRSQSSTREAQKRFARLMELEDLSPLTKENEGLDSGLGGRPLAAERKLNITTDILQLITTEVSEAIENIPPTHKTRVLLEPSAFPPLILEEEKEDTDEEPPLKRLSREQKRGLEPHNILKQMENTSLDKVREWLMNVPSEEDTELEKPAEAANDSDDSESFPSLTIDFKQHNDSNLNSIKETDGRSKGLEEQVFGAVYKRKKGNMARSSPPDILTYLECNKETKEPDFQTFNEDQNTGDKAQEHQIIDLLNDSSEFFKGAEQNVTDGNNKFDSKNLSGPELNNMPQNDSNGEGEEKDASPLLKTRPHKLRRKSRKNMRNALEQVDSDLQEQAKTEAESTEQKKTDKTKGRKPGLKKGKSARARRATKARVTKPLVLVEVQNGETASTQEPKMKLGLDEVQVHIENYPSSEDQDAHISRSTRRTKRLQCFAEEVRGSKKKACHLKVTTCHKQDKSQEVKGLTKNNVAAPKCAAINGCVYCEDLGGIEKIVSCESPTVRAPREALQDTVAKLPNAEKLPEAGCAPVMPGEAAEINSVQESDIQTDPNNVQLETLGCEDAIEKMEEDDKNDSELDTEQLLRSFKATKRKSFLLGGPDVKRSCSLEESNAPKTEDVQFSSTKQPLENEKSLTPNQDALQDNSNSLYSDLIPPSTSPAQKSKASLLPDQEISYKPIGTENSADTCLKSTTSGALSPNKVSKLETPSPHLSVVPQIVNSVLCFTTAHFESGEPQEQSVNESLKSSHVSQCSKAEDIMDGLSMENPVTTEKTSAENPSERLLNTENSLTPDGLLTQAVQRANVGNGDDSGSSGSSIRINAKKRKTQTLESLTEFDSSDSKEEFPTLATIFNPNPRSGQEKCEPAKAGFSEAKKCLTPDIGENVSHPPACPSPDFVNSSQASADLFDTPEEADVQGNKESSQFSSEVLDTQQKIALQQKMSWLKKEMAQMAKAIFEENSPESKPDTKQSSKMQGPESNRPLLCNNNTGQSSERNNAERNTKQNPPDAKAVTKTCVAKHGSAAETAQSSTTCAPASRTASSSTTVLPKMVLVSSGLGHNEQIMVKRFAKSIGSIVVPQVTPDVTHVVMHTDERLVCERTLKYFIGIASRKWVVSFQWISQCFQQKKILNESLFEVKGDVVNGDNHQGPMKARTTEDTNLLLKGYTICFQGPFTNMTTDEMALMVELCGATVVKDPLLLNGKQKTHQLVIVPGSALPVSKDSNLYKGATVVRRGWLLDTVATYTIQDCENYTTAPI